MVNPDGKVAIPISASYSYGYLCIEDPVATGTNTVTAKETCRDDLCQGAIPTPPAPSPTPMAAMWQWTMSTPTALPALRQPRRRMLYRKVEPAAGGWTLTNTLRSGFVVRWADQVQQLRALYHRIAASATHICESR